MIAQILSLLITLLLCSETTVAANAPLYKRDSDSSRLPGKYIVVLEEDRGVDAVVSSLPTSIKVKQRYTHALKGFAGEFSEAQVQALRSDPNVKYIEEDQIASVTSIQTNAPYNLAITSQQRRLQPAAQTRYFWKRPRGNNVTVYVVDSGVFAEHPEFGGRASQLVNFVTEEANQDLKGHGTHVAGTIISKSYGVFKDGYAVGVKVLNGTGSGPWSRVIAGIDWVARNAQGPSVINLSLGGAFSQAINDAVARASAAGITVVVSAGNTPEVGACSLSPASAPQAITVGAIGPSYAVADFSSEDTCVDIHAPGVDILSTAITGRTMTLSGTSMASPHVAGVAAYFMSQFGSSNQALIRSKILKYADSGLIRGDLEGAPNLLANNGWRDF